ncbi:hypothetical protein NPIL_477361 [Nephila pilipes]|uniref:Uncharacterized protein n=1 Tax=Nephila pilipes TaxID=299642 RepID=A0A8X6PRJ8_NEPPI|nr:hypothetical protein NPIL_477361 [Nephila pilipes]
MLGIYYRMGRSIPKESVSDPFGSLLNYVRGAHIKDSTGMPARKSFLVFPKKEQIQIEFRVPQQLADNEERSLRNQVIESASPYRQRMRASFASNTFCVP